MLNDFKDLIQSILDPFKYDNFSLDNVDIHDVQHLLRTLNILTCKDKYFEINLINKYKPVFEKISDLEYLPLFAFGRCTQTREPFKIDFFNIYGSNHEYSLYSLYSIIYGYSDKDIDEHPDILNKIKLIDLEMLTDFKDGRFNSIKPEYVNQLTVEKITRHFGKQNSSKALILKRTQDKYSCELIDCGSEEY